MWHLSLTDAFFRTPTSLESRKELENLCLSPPPPNLKVCLRAEKQQARSLAQPSPQSWCCQLTKAVPLFFCLSLLTFESLLGLFSQYSEHSRKNSHFASDELVATTSSKTPCFPPASPRRKQKSNYLVLIKTAREFPSRLPQIPILPGRVSSLDALTLEIQLLLLGWIACESGFDSTILASSLRQGKKIKINVSTL